MKRKLIFLAVGGALAGSAFAQTNVTVYGLVDAGYVHASGNGVKHDGIDSGPSAGPRLGFRGEEALGNGLKAVFVLEYGLSLDVNAGVGTALARQQYVGLGSASAGTLTLGRQYAPGFDATIRNTPFAAAVPSPAGILQSAAGTTVAPNSNSRWNNAVAYVSPNFAGFTVRGIYGFGQSNEDKVGSTERDARFGIGGNYANGPVSVDLIYQTQQNTAGVDKNEWYLGGSYDFKAAKLYASYQTLNDKSTADDDSKIWQLAVGVPVSSAGTVVAAYASLNRKHSSDNDSDAIGVGYLHALSKRTTLYSMYTRTDNERLAYAAGPIAAVAAADKKNSYFTVGIRHAF